MPGSYPSKLIRTGNCGETDVNLKQYMCFNLVRFCSEPKNSAKAKKCLTKRMSLQQRPTILTVQICKWRALASQSTLLSSVKASQDEQNNSKNLHLLLLFYFVLRFFAFMQTKEHTVLRRFEFQPLQNFQSNSELFFTAYWFKCCLLSKLCQQKNWAQHFVEGSRRYWPLRN